MTAVLPRLDGLCRGVSTNLFFPDEFELPSPRALRLCARCPIREACLQWAIEHDEIGIWGGTTDGDRQKMTRQRHRVKCPGCLSHDVVEDVHCEICLACGVSWPV